MENILLNIDSRYRNSNVYKNAGKFTYELENPIKNVGYIRLSSIELNTLFYEFSHNKNNNYFIITHEDIDYKIIIEDGNYTSSDMIIYIQNLLDTNINKIANTKINITWNHINYTTNFSNNTYFELKFNNNNNLNKSLGRRLGFLNNIYNTDNIKHININNNNSYEYDSESYLDTIFSDYVFLKVNNYGNIINKVRNTNLLAKIILPNVQFLMDNGANYLSKEQIFRAPIDIYKLDIELISPNGETVQMITGSNISLTLEVGRIYDFELYKSYETYSLRTYETFTSGSALKNRII